MRGQTASVIVPACNEASVIARTLDSLLCEAEPDEFEIVVVCNGCQDGTADAVRLFSDVGVRVVEVEQPSKTGALNAGDALASVYPRLYLDADVELDTAGARAMVEALRDFDCVVAAPLLLVADGSRAARVYWKAWQLRNPSPRSGTGCYGLSRRARVMFGEFPDVLGDDQFIAQLFDPQQVPTAVTRVRPPRTLEAILRRRVRIERGNRQLPRLSRVEATTNRWATPPPKGLEFLSLGLLVAVHSLARGIAGMSRGNGWAQDLTTRRPEPMPGRTAP